MVHRLRRAQRPTISYSETKIFDKYFDQLFHKEYDPENIQALHDLFDVVMSKWTKDNPMGLNESLLAMKSYAPYHHLFAISVIFCEINKMPESVPNPALAIKKLRESDLLDYVVDTAGKCLNAALENASAEASNDNKIFSPQNWIKAKASLKDTRSAVRNSLQMLKLIPQGADVVNKLNSGLAMEKEAFETRWTAD